MNAPFHGTFRTRTGPRTPPVSRPPAARRSTGALLTPFFLGAVAFAGCIVARAQVTDPMITAWQTTNSRQYARVWQNSAARASGSSSTTWPAAGTSYSGGGQSIPAYAEVQRVLYSNAYVYVYTSGLAGWTMGPWSAGFPNWPSDRNGLARFPRSPVVATTRTSAQAGIAAYLRNGVALFDCLDGQSYAVATGQVSFTGDRLWNRTAPAGEGATMDPTNAHQQGTGVYHSHFNPVGMRYALGDHVAYNASTYTYSEATSVVTAHSPLLGYALDGFPVYGPYGYSSAMDASSGVRRMVSGFVLRDGTNGTTNLASAGRHALPGWAAAAAGTSAALTAAQYGPAVSSAYPLGTFGEDYDYLGNLGRTQGVDFDLDVCNARYCVTPEYPSGTWAYFVAIDSAGNEAYPYVFNYQFEGSVPPAVTAITETVTEYIRAGQASPIGLTASTITGTSVTLAWTSVEGGTYRVDSSPDGSTWTTAAGAVASSGTSSTWTTTAVAAWYRVTLTALATYDTDGTGGVSGIGNLAEVQAVGSTGTAMLVNASARVAVGGVAGTAIVGFGLGSTLPVLVRGVGPTLSEFGVSGWLPDPVLDLFSGSTQLASNAAWPAADAAVFAEAGAFALESGSRDAAIATTLSAGAYSGTVASASGDAGVALVEIYSTSSGSAGLTNASARAYVGTGQQILIPGFVVSGTGTLKLLVRAIGPGLASYGVAGALADPVITLYQGSTAIATNSGWSSASNEAAIAAAAASVGAFSLSPGSHDAALLVSLGSGAYSVAVTSASGGSGTALAEIYAAP